MNIRGKIKIQQFATVSTILVTIGVTIVEELRSQVLKRNVVKRLGPKNIKRIIFVIMCCVYFLNTGI